MNIVFIKLTHITGENNLPLQSNQGILFLAHLGSCRHVRGFVCHHIPFLPKPVTSPSYLALSIMMSKLFLVFCMWFLLLFYVCTFWLISYSLQLILYISISCSTYENINVVGSFLFHILLLDIDIVICSQYLMHVETG